MQITHSVHSSSGSLLIQAGRVWLSTEVGRNDLSLSGEAEGEDIFSSSFIIYFTVHTHPEKHVGHASIVSAKSCAACGAWPTNGSPPQPRKKVILNGYVDGGITER